MHTKAVEARETKKQTTIGAGEAEENDDAMGQECEAPDDGVAQGCDPTQDGVAQGCDPTEDDGVAQKCDDGARVAQVCDPAQDDGVAQVCDPAQEVAQVDGPLPSSFKTCALVPDPETIHSQVLLRSASELEAAFLPEAHEVPVPDTPLKTPDRGSEDVSTTPSTRKVLRNTSSYKAVSSPVPFLSETAFDVLMGCNDAEGADSSAAGSAQMVMPKVLFPEPTDPAEVVPESAEAPDVEMHDNPYSRELEVVAVPKRVKEGSVAIPTPEKPDPKKAKLEEQARVRRQQAQETWDSVVYPLREKAPDAMPVYDSTRNRTLCLSSNHGVMIILAVSTCTSFMNGLHQLAYPGATPSSRPRTYRSSSTCQPRIRNLLSSFSMLGHSMSTEHSFMLISSSKLFVSMPSRSAVAVIRFEHLCAQ